MYNYKQNRIRQRLSRRNCFTIAKNITFYNIRTVIKTATHGTH